jgi:hypothetical protein
MHMFTLRHRFGSRLLGPPLNTAPGIARCFKGHAAAGVVVRGHHPTWLPCPCMCCAVSRYCFKRNCTSGAGGARPREEGGRGGTSRRHSARDQSAATSKVAKSVTAVTRSSARDERGHHRRPRARHGDEGSGSDHADGPRDGDWDVVVSDGHGGDSGKEGSTTVEPALEDWSESSHHGRQRERGLGRERAQASPPHKASVSVGLSPFTELLCPVRVMVPKVSSAPEAR